MIKKEQYNQITKRIQIKNFELSKEDKNWIVFVMN